MATQSLSGSPSQASGTSGRAAGRWDAGWGHLCAGAAAGLWGSEVTASTCQHLPGFPGPETTAGEPGSLAPTLFNLIAEHKRYLPHI